MADDFRKLMVTSCEVLKKGTSASGNEWTMFEVFAVDESGTPVEAKLRAFDPLPINDLVEYGVTKRVDTRHGTSYTLDLPRELKPKRTPKRTAGQKLDDLQLRLDDLNQRFEWLLEQLHQLQGKNGLELTSPPNLGLQSQDPSAGASPAMATSADDIPF